MDTHNIVFTLVEMKLAHHKTIRNAFYNPNLIQTKSQNIIHFANFYLTRMLGANIKLSFIFIHITKYLNSENTIFNAHTIGKKANANFPT